MNEDFITILQTIIAEQGKEALLNPAKCKALLADYTRGEYPIESRLVLQALDAGVQRAIDGAGELKACKQQQVKVLREKYFLADGKAAEVVDMIALVLRGDRTKTQVEASPKPEAVPQPAAVPTKRNKSLSPITPPNEEKKKKNTIRNVLIAIAGVALLVFLIVFILNYVRTTANSDATVDKDTSYAFGMLISSQLGFPGVRFSYDDFRDGFRDYNEARETRITTEKAMEHINNLFMMYEQTLPDAVDKDTSYALGMFMSSQLGLPELVFDYNFFRDGFRDYNEARETRLTQEKAMEHINTLFMRVQAESDEQAFIQGELNREEGEAYLAANKLRDNIITTPSGLQYEVLVQGSGDKPGFEDTVQVHYEGTLINGTVFDSSYSRGIPAEFPLYGVIQGWTEGLQLMSEGSTYVFYIPSELAYGQYGAGSSVPPNATLIFRVELLSIIRY